MSLRRHVAIVAGPLSLDALLARLGLADGGAEPGGGEVGAVVTFSGVVRPTEGDRTIARLDYEHYEEMATREMDKLVDEAARRWPLHRVGLEHRVGAVGAGESSVLVVVGAGHRAEAFEAARFLIDELKKSVPIWKAAPEP
jgi:molybdopterin synthase catalytic subunit